MKRRDFFKKSGKILLEASALGGLATLIPHTVWGANNSRPDTDELPHFMLIIRVHGSMDSTLGLNPWLTERPNANDLYLDKSYDLHRKIDGTSINLGPSAAGLAPHVKDLSVVNGVFMGTTDVGHPAAQNYITTAKTSPNAPHFIAELAEVHRLRDQNLREKILFNGSMNTFDLNMLSRVPTQLWADDSSSQSGKVQSKPKVVLNQSLSNSASAFSRAHRGLFDNIDKNNRFEETLGHLKANVSSLGAEHAVVAAFASGYARFAQVDLSEENGLDLHVDFVDRHQAHQKIVWDRIASLISVLKETTFLDTNIPLFPNLVTLKVVTEFSRLPFLNGNRGKDHNYFDNSILLGGRGIAGGTSIGGHHLFASGIERRESQLSGCHIDFKTGQVVKNNYYNTKDIDRTIERDDVALIRPENILATLGKVFNLDPDFIRLYSKDTKILPNVIK